MAPRMPDPRGRSRGERAQVTDRTDRSVELERLHRDDRVVLAGDEQERGGHAVDRAEDAEPAVERDHLERVVAGARVVPRRPGRDLLRTPDDADAGGTLVDAQLDVGVQ